MTRPRVLGLLLRPRCIKGSSTLNRATIKPIIWEVLHDTGSHCYRRALVR